MLNYLPLTFNDLLRINGVSNLYTIARSHIITFSSHMYTEGKLVLPMINVLEFYNNVASDIETESYI